jgi:ketosteroid isomerase-like protein
MTERENVDIVRRLFQAVEDRDIEPMYEIYAPDVVIREAASLPYGGEYRGHDGMERHGLGYLEAWERFQTGHDRRLEPEFSGDGEMVFVRWRQRAHAADGSRLDLPAVSVYRLRDGCIVESTMHHLDTAALARFFDQAARS